tara:strand:+ start:3750 stop:4274 length:525 start_codon:yes stop_codon:yes gene_type:complete
MEISFKEFVGLSKEEQIHLSSTINEELSGRLKKKKMLELEKKLKAHDWYFAYADDGRSYRKGRDEQDEIHKLVQLLGDDGKSLHNQYARKAGVMESLKKQVNKEKSIEDRIDDVKEKHSLFPEMEQVQRDIALGFQGEGKVLANKHHFTTGNPYENADKWIAPSPQRKRGWQDK